LLTDPHDNYNDKSDDAKELWHKKPVGKIGVIIAIIINESRDA
jgi:hypothetical protein